MYCIAIYKAKSTIRIYQYRLFISISEMTYRFILEMIEIKITILKKEPTYSYEKER